MSVLVFSLAAGTILAQTQSEIQAETEVEASILKPGDFFYFVKKTVEGIQLLVTVNDMKQAKLHASFAEKRLLEAKALIAVGDEDRAEQTITKAIEQQGKSMVYVMEKANGEAKTEAKAKVEAALETKLSQNLELMTSVIFKLEQTNMATELTRSIENNLDQLVDKLIGLKHNQSIDAVAKVDTNISLDEKLEMATELVGEEEGEGEVGSETEAKVEGDSKLNLNLLK